MLLEHLDSLKPLLPVIGIPRLIRAAVLRSWIGLFVALMLDSIFPGFEPSKWLMPLWVASLELFKAIEGCISANALFFSTGVQLVNESTKSARRTRTSYSSTEDPSVSLSTTAAVRDTCALYPESDTEFLVGPRGQLGCDQVHLALNGSRIGSKARVWRRADVSGPMWMASCLLSSAYRSTACCSRSGLEHPSGAMRCRSGYRREAS